MNALVARACRSAERPGTAWIAIRAIESSDQQVARTVIRKRGVERNRHPACCRGCKCAIPHDVALRQGLHVGRTGKLTTRHVLHVQRYVVHAERRRVVVVETDGIDRSGSPNLIGSVNLLGERVVEIHIDGIIIVRCRTLANSHNFRSCYAHEGQHKRHHQRKYFLLHNDLKLVRKNVK